MVSNTVYQYTTKPNNTAITSTLKPVHQTTCATLTFAPYSNPSVYKTMQMMDFINIQLTEL